MSQMFSLSMLTSAVSDVREYPLPGAGDTIVRATAASYDQVREYAEAVAKGGQTLKIHQARMIASCILQPDSDQPMFASETEVQKHMSEPGTGRIMMALLVVALLRNGLKDEAPEEVEKK